MNNLNQLKSRFLRDTPQVRMGGIASDLMRFYSLLHSQKPDQELAGQILTELKCFTEWVADDVNFNSQLTILNLQRKICHWESSIVLSRKLKKIETEAKKWSNKIIGISGLTER